MLTQLTKWRRELHKIPELGLKEYKTQTYLRNELEALGYKVNDLVGTGLSVYLDYQKEHTIAFRSDMDALSINESNDIDFKSKTKGLMHACGHDGHMSALLGLAKALKEEKVNCECNILLIFQPAEESPGAAQYVVESGIFDHYHVEAIFGTHIMPSYPQGQLVCKAGPLMAQCGELDVTIHGKGAHAGLPSEGIDSIVIASHLINQYQNIISRRKSPFEPAIINIGEIHGGSARNSVAEQTHYHGTVRCYNGVLFDEMIKDMMKLHQAAEIAYGCKIEATCPPLYPAVINDEHLFAMLENIEDIKVLKEPLMLAEDFAYYQKKIPGLFIFIGSQTEEYQSGLHTSTFNFNEIILQRVVEIYMNIIRNYKGDK